MRIPDRLRRWTPFGPRIGLTVTPEWIGAVMVHGPRLVWSNLDAIGPEDTRETVIARVLQCVLAHHRPPWPRPSVWVAIDTPQSRVKTVRGLPPVTDARVVAQVLAATPERFFLSSAGGLVITGARMMAPGVAEAAAFDVAMLDEIQNACAAVRLQTTLFVPVEVAVMTAPDEDESGQTPKALAAAYGATRVARHEPLALRWGRSESLSAPEHHQRLRVAGIAAVVSATIAVATPVGLALRTSRIARHTIAALAPARANALTTERDVATMAAAIADVETFEQHRVSKTRLISQLTQALPATAVITTFTTDTTGTTVVVLAPRAADVVRGIEEMLGTTHVEMLGPVTREVTGATVSTPVPPPPGRATATEMERVTVRFRVAAQGTTARRPLGGTE